jgi:tetratricopeptide (TPR) repeat protein
MDNLFKLTPLEQEIDALLGKSNFYLQSYRAIEAQNVLNDAMRLMEGNVVKWQVKAAVYRNMGQALFQRGKATVAMNYFVKSYEVIEDGNDKAAVAGLIAGYYLRDGKKQEAEAYAEKALQTATAPELFAGPYQIQGGIAVLDGDYPKAIELMTKAAEMAESAHCLTDLSMIILDLSTIYMRMGKHEIALSEVFRAERYVKECRNLDLYIRCAIRRAKILYVMGKDEEAKTLILALDEQKN